MSAESLDLITVTVRRDESGWFFATSDDCPGLFVSDPSAERVIRLVPESIELLYQARFGRKVKAVPLHKPSAPASQQADTLPFAAIPVEILAQTPGGPIARPLV